MNRLTCRYPAIRVVIPFLLVTLSACPPPGPTPAEAASRLLEQFDTLDTNDDGLTLAEARRGLGTIGQALFTALDTNGDGRLSLSELQEAAGVGSEGEGEGEGEGRVPNAYSWDGSWTPEPGELPPPGFFDAIYFDGHLLNNVPTPLLPPGSWDFVIVPEPLQVAALANFNSFRMKVADLVLLLDENGDPYGWFFESAVPGAMAMDFTADPYNGSSGAEIVDTGPGGFIRFSGSFNTGDGPDVLRFATCFAADVRTGSDLTGSNQDNDLVIGGDDAVRPIGDGAMRSAGLHTGPGDDLVFMTNMEQAQIDLGNGADGRTDTLDPDDGNDMAILQRNLRDCRIIGGNGDDVFVWYIDETQPTNQLLANSFFGAGAWDPAVWEDTGTDRLILVVPDDTEVISGLEIVAQGTLRIGMRASFPDTPVPDGPTENDVFARYFNTAGVSPEGNRHTVAFDYRSASNHVSSGDIFLTAIEELQIGIGESAKVYRIDDVNGGATLAPELTPMRNIPSRATYHGLVDDLVTP